MRAVIQRVRKAQVVVAGNMVGAIEQGLLVLLGVEKTDTEVDARYLSDKVVNARVFTDAADKMNLSVSDVNGRVLAISQFTLLGDLRRGRRPSFSQAMEPEPAKHLFEVFCAHTAQLGVPVETGTFRAHMEVSLCNSGPVTLIVDSKRQF